MSAPLLKNLETGLKVGGIKSDNDPVCEEVKELQMRLNEAFVVGDEQTIRRLMAEDGVSTITYHDTPLRLNDAISMELGSDLEIDSYIPGRMSVCRIGNGIALLTYVADRQGRYKGIELTKRISVSSIWVHRDGEWRLKSYQETSI